MRFAHLYKDKLTKSCGKFILKSENYKYSQQKGGEKNEGENRPDSGSCL